MQFKRGVSTRELSFIGVMTALCISSNYLMVGIPNIKLMDLFVFISGYLMGSLSGAMVGCLTWLVYGTLNPYGFHLPTLVATCLGESLYGIAGGFSAKFGLTVPPVSSTRLTEKAFWGISLELGILGFLLTFIYDLFTNVVTGIILGVSLLTYIAFGIPFTLAHEVSNFFFFLLGGTALINAVQKLTCKGGELS